MLLLEELIELNCSISTDKRSRSHLTENSVRVANPRAAAKFYGRLTSEVIRIYRDRGCTFVRQGQR
jgi:hypothetical protein